MKKIIRKFDKKRNICPKSHCGRIKRILCKHRTQVVKSKNKKN